MDMTIFLLWLVSLLGTETTCRTIRGDGPRLNLKEHNVSIRYNHKEVFVPRSHLSNDADEEVRINSDNEKYNGNTENKEDNSFHIGRIVNGKNASILDYPWQVVIKAYVFFICGGVIINADTILTAAHCFEDDPGLRYRYYITAGDDDPNYNNTGEQIRRIISAKLYDDYIGQSNAWDGDVAVLKLREPLKFTVLNLQFDDYIGRSNGWDGDVAVLKLSEPLEFTSRIQPIKLANKKKERRALRKGNCVVTGFGYIQQDPDTFADSLQEVAITMKDRDFCSARVAELHGTTFTERMICSYDNNKGACRGDSGGPVMCRYKRKMILVGLVSWSASDCFVGFNVYARISKLSSWINRNI